MGFSTLLIVYSAVTIIFGVYALYDIVYSILPPDKREPSWLTIVLALLVIVSGLLSIVVEVVRP